MAKNRTMRVAVLMLALTLITSCFVGGTFAKYVTKDSASDSARVAKFGVEVNAEGSDMFKNEYNTDDTTYTGSLSVKSVDEADVVAPGTKSSEDGALKFSITGTPEVAVKVSIDTVAANMKDVVLPAGTYTDWTQADYADDNLQFTTTADYYPVVWKLDVVDHNVDGDYTGTIAEGNLNDIVDAVNAYVASYEPNTKLDADFTLSWEWAFDGEKTLSTNDGDNTTTTDVAATFDAATVDQADTLLGNIAAGLDTADGASTDVAFDFTITVEQID